MRMLWVVIAGCFLAVCPAVLAQAHTEFKAALQKKYAAFTVTCNTCHVNGEEKKVRNDLGKIFSKELMGKDVTKKLAAVKALEADDPARVKVKEAVTADFNAVLGKVEAMSGPGGKTYGELLKTGKLDGLTPKE